MKKTILLFVLTFNLFANERSPQAKKIIYAFNNLRENNLHILDKFYASDASFVDPIGSHQGLDSIKKYYKGLYKNVDSIIFQFHDIISQSNKHSAVWTMKLKSKKLRKGKTITLSGNSVLIFNQDNLVSYHRDYFDMSEFIYENLPGVGWIFKKFRTSFAK